jgi:hypothetical protein
VYTTGTASSLGKTPPGGNLHTTFWIRKTIDPVPGVPNELTDEVVVLWEESFHAGHENGATYNDRIWLMWNASNPRHMAYPNREEIPAFEIEFDRFKRTRNNLAGDAPVST